MRPVRSRAGRPGPGVDGRRHGSIVVTGDGAQAVITRSPFRIEFRDGGGRPVLGELAGDSAAPHPVPPTPHPEPSSAQLLARPTLYAPLTFMVGASRTVQPCPALRDATVRGGRPGGGPAPALALVPAWPCEGKELRAVPGSCADRRSRRRPSRAGRVPERPPHRARSAAAAREDRPPPLVKIVHRRPHGRSHVHRVVARVTLSSGRRVMLRKRFRACDGRGAPSAKG